MKRIRIVRNPLDEPCRFSVMPDDERQARSLWVAVLLRAVQDALAPQTIHWRTQGEASPPERARARHWLLHDVEDFPAVCLSADLNPDHIRHHARLLIEQHDRLHNMITGFRTGIRDQLQQSPHQTPHQHSTGGYIETSDHFPGTGGGRLTRDRAELEPLQTRWRHAYDFH